MLDNQADYGMIKSVMIIIFKNNKMGVSTMLKGKVEVVTGEQEESVMQ